MKSRWKALRKAQKAELLAERRERKGRGRVRRAFKRHGVSAAAVEAMMDWHIGRYEADLMRLRRTAASCYMLGLPAPEGIE